MDKKSRSVSYNWRIYFTTKNITMTSLTNINPKLLVLIGIILMVISQFTPIVHLGINQPTFYGWQFTALGAVVLFDPEMSLFVNIFRVLFILNTLAILVSIIFLINIKTRTAYRYLIFTTIAANILTVVFFGNPSMAYGYFIWLLAFTFMILGTFSKLEASK